MSIKKQDSALATLMGEHVASWKASGLTVVQFCADKDFTVHKFNYWRYKIEKEPTKVKTVKGGFVRLRVKEEAPPVRTAARILPSVEVCLANGTRIAFYDTISRDLLKAFL
jgi:hypothetical protein